MAHAETPKTPAINTSTSSTLTSLPHLVTVKLSHENYLLWHAQMSPCLRGQHLFGFVDGSSSPPNKFLPASTTPNPEYSVWLQQDQMILSALIFSLTEPLIAQVVGCLTARDVWFSLKSLFQSQSQACLVQLQYQLANLKKGSDYFCKLKNLRDTLAITGKVLSSSELVTYLLAGLGPDYDSFVTSVTT